MMNRKKFFLEIKTAIVLSASKLTSQTFGNSQMVLKSVFIAPAAISEGLSRVPWK